MKKRSLIFISLLICISLSALVYSDQFSPFAHAQTSSQINQNLLNVPYIPDEVIVQYKDNATPVAISQALNSTQPQTFLEAIQFFFGQGPQQKANELKNQSDALDQKIKVVQKTQLLHPKKDKLGMKNHYLFKLNKGANIQSVLQTLNQQTAIVQSAMPNYVVHVTSTTPNDPLFSSQWGLAKIQMPQVWDTAKGATSVIVAIIDTGVDYNHPDLPSANIIKGRDFATCNHTNANGTCALPANCPQLANGYCSDDPMDDFGHGTHVAGIIGATTDNNLGVSGINWQVRILAIKSMGADGLGSVDEVMQGIQYAIDNNAKVINMSLGFNEACAQVTSPTTGTPLQSVIDNAFQNGILVVAAAGNGIRNGSSIAPADAANFSPASCNNVLAVGATDQNDNRAHYSNYGSVVQIAAPGGDIDRTGVAIPAAGILSTKASQCSTLMCPPILIVDTNYQYQQGTSMASPHVAGVAGLLLGSNPTLSTQQLRNCLVNNADVITTDLSIGPRLNAFRSLTACGAQPTPSFTPTPTITPSITLTTTPSVTPTISPTPSPTFTPTPSPTTGPTITGSITPTMTSAPSLTPTGTIPTSSVTPTMTPSTTSPTVTPTTVQTTITPSPTVDCGIDFSCFISSSTNCGLAKATVTLPSVTLFGFSAQAKDYFETKGLTPQNTCTFYLKRLYTSVKPPTGSSLDQYYYAQSATRILDGFDGTCLFQPSDLTNMLTRWQQGSFNSGTTTCDFSGHCTTTGGDFGNAVCSGLAFQSPIPSITPYPGATILSFTIQLDGIGSAGDNTNPSQSSLSNQFPFLVSQPLWITLFNSSNNISDFESGTLAYNDSTGMFYSSIIFRSSLPTGDYKMNIKTAAHLQKTIATIHIISGITTQVPTIRFVAGDVLGNNVLDLLSYNAILNCVTNSVCDFSIYENTDLNADGTHDESDLNLFLREFKSQ